MDVKKYTVTIAYKGVATNVICEEFQVGKVPQVWTCIPAKRPAHSKCFTFYRQKQKNVWWWELPEPKESIAQKIAAELNKI